MSLIESNRRRGTFVFVAAMLVFGVILFGRTVGCWLFPNLANCAQQPDPGSTQPPPLPAGAVSVYLYSANTKENWINAVTARFNQEQVKTSLGHPIVVTVKHGTSGGSQQAILNGSEQPQAWSPGDQSWVDGANQAWDARTGRPLVRDNCRPTVYAPVGFAMWRPMAEAMGWPDRPIGWNELVALAADLQGWAHYGHSEWRQFQFGHTNPVYSNSGLLIITALAHGVLGQTTALSPDQVFRPELLDAMRTVEQHTYHYGEQSRDLLSLMIKRGPAYLHAVNTTEAETVKTNVERAGELPLPLAFVMPANGTFWTEQPYCVVDAEWVTDEQKEAARIFGDYLLHPDQQRLTVENYLRPVNPDVPLACPLCLELGADSRVTIESVPALPSPSADLANAVKDAWLQTKKKATLIVLLDTSGSMQGDNLKNAVAGTLGFLQRLHPDDVVIVMTFNGAVTQLEPHGRSGDVSEELMRTVSGIYASGGTALNDAVCAGARRANALQAEDVAAGNNRLYGVVVLSDGQDTASAASDAEMFATCLRTGEAVDGIKIFTIAYGANADQDFLASIADRTNGKLHSADAATIEAIYRAISAEQ
jgi:Ca-activated chloride channel family protein